MPVATKYAATGLKCSCPIFTVLIARNSSAGASSRKIRFDSSFTAPPETQPRRPASQPAAIRRTTGPSAERTGEFTAARIAQAPRLRRQKVIRAPTVMLRPRSGAASLMNEVWLKASLFVRLLTRR